MLSVIIRVQESDKNWLWVSFWVAVSSQGAMSQPEAGMIVPGEEKVSVFLHLFSKKKEQVRKGRSCSFLWDFTNWLETQGIIRKWFFP